MNGRMSSELIAILGVGATVLVIGVAILALGWNMYSSLNGRIDQVQVENQRQYDALNERLDTMQAENQRQHDTTRGEIIQLRTEMNRRFDTMQTENQRQHDAIEEALRAFEGRITRLEERTGVGLQDAE